MKSWLTRRGAPVATHWLKRFDPEHWTVDFPRGCMASLVTGRVPHQLDVALSFLRKSDLAGLIWSSEDRISHPAHARETSRDYRGCTLSFRWRSSGLAALDAIGGPTLTIEGRDAGGQAKSWFVRLWNYASGSGEDALVTMDFDALDGGFLLPQEADPVFAGDIDRMFISLVPPDYEAGSDALRPAPIAAQVTISALHCDGAGSVLRVGDAVAPEHGLGIASSYDDQYNVAPSRLVEGFVRAGFRGSIIHYVGMSHYPALGGDGRVDPTQGLCGPALAWHREFARAAASLGYDVIWSLSYELLDMLCPEDWKQRDLDGNPALTGWEPPSTLLSPASQGAMAYLQNIARELVELSIEAGLTPRLQVGEPWWWTSADGRIFMYDDAATALLGATPVADVGASLDDAQKARMDAAGVLLAQSTAALVAAAREQAPETVSHLLVYLPTVLDPKRPELRRANLPLGWAMPAFDRLQIEDYDWVIGGAGRQRRVARELAEARLGYPPDRQHYLAGFVVSEHDRAHWQDIVDAALDARRRGVEQAFIWAWPQVARDGLTLIGEEPEMDAFADMSFPLAIGQDASVAPGFSTNILTSAGGYEHRNANWQSARLRFDAGPGVRGEAELEALIGFFRARRGPAVAFRFRDPFDHSSSGMTGEVGPTDQWLGDGDGVRTSFALTKTYGEEEVRRITRPENGSVRVAVGGVERNAGWAVEPLGFVSFDEAPAVGAAVTAGYRFDVPVRFEEDRLDINRTSFRAGEAPSVPLVEVREA